MESFLLMILVSFLAFVYRYEISEMVSERAFSMAIGAVVLMSTGLVFAQDGSVTEAPNWLIDFLTYISTIPKIGPVIVEVFKWLGVIASVFTALSIAVQVILVIPEVVARFAGAPELANKIKALNEKIQPYLKLLSMFNTKKK